MPVAHDEPLLSDFQNDAKLISIMYRTHKALAPVCKVSGLYAFDALARAARSYANKHKQACDPKSEKGNCATFLMKMEGVLDGLFKDMLSLENEEAKVRHNLVSQTFPLAMSVSVLPSTLRTDAWITHNGT